MSSLYTKYPRTTLWLLQEDDFIMGGSQEDAMPRFDAYVAPIYIGKTVITNEQYEAFQPNHERGEKTPGDDDPAVNVSFKDATAYCQWYSELTQKKFRLPTEVEWEYACRGDAQTTYYWGDSPEAAAKYMCDAQSMGATIPPLETLTPNDFGLYDMLGMVWEWTSSLYLPYPVNPNDGRDDPEKDGNRVARGGSFRVDRSEIGCAVRNSLNPDSRFSDVGFRIVRSLR